MTDTTHVQRKFEAMGARAKFRVSSNVPRRRFLPREASRANPFTIDVSDDRQGQFFDIRVSEGEKVDFSVLAVDPEDRHLLLMARAPVTSSGRPEIQKFLCGHDERFWFVAGVPADGISSVHAAKTALKPAAVRTMEIQCRVRPKDLHRHRNRAFVRQGEWFFVPVSDLVVDERVVLYREPLRRGSGKPHVAESLFRRGGTRVYVCRDYPNGLAEEQYKALPTSNPVSKTKGWSVMVRDPEAYVKGRITHPDHKTIILPSWHRVLPNAEVASRNVAFLD